MAEQRRDNATATAVATGVCPVCQSPRAELWRPCPHCGSPAIMDPPAERREGGAQASVKGVTDALFSIRASDIEPYIGLRYLSKLFRLMAIVMVLLLVAEVITGFVQQGSAAIPTLLPEVSRLIVLAGLLWGAGDLAILLIDVGHDVRAGRILLGRQATQHQRELRAHPSPEQRVPLADGDRVVRPESERRV